MYSLEPYVLQKHTTLKSGGRSHYDLRIKIPNGNSLASWAMPKKSIPKNSGEKYLMVRTNDHSQIWLHMKKFEIPADSYGAGTIETLEKGKVEILGWGDDSYITLNFTKSKYFSGKYQLIKIKGKQVSDRKNLWIIMKKFN